MKNARLGHPATPVLSSLIRLGGPPVGGGQVDHNNNPVTMMDRMRSITPGPILKWGTAGVVIYIIIDEGSRLYPPRNLVPVP